MREHDLPHLLVLDKNMRIVDTVRMRDLTLGDEDCHNPEDSKISIANPQKFLPLADVSLESHALGNPTGRDQAALDLLAALSGVIAI